MDADWEEIEKLKADDDFRGLGQKAMALMKMPQSLCKTRGNCCRVATFKGTLTLEDIQALANSDDPDAGNAKDFLTLFEAYDTQEAVREIAPVFVDRVLETIPDEEKHKVPFFKCRFLGESGRCMVHEDRPTGCRAYPFPHKRTIYHPGCGFEQRGKENWEKVDDIVRFMERRREEFS